MNESSPSGLGDDGAVTLVPGDDIVVHHKPLTVVISAAGSTAELAPHATEIVDTLAAAGTWEFGPVAEALQGLVVSHQPSGVAALLDIKPDPIIFLFDEAHAIEGSETHSGSGRSDWNTIFATADDVTLLVGSSASAPPVEWSQLQAGTVPGLGARAKIVAFASAVPGDNQKPMPAEAPTGPDPEPDADPGPDMNADADADSEPDANTDGDGDGDQSLDRETETASRPVFVSDTPAPNRDQVGSEPSSENEFSAPPPGLGDLRPVGSAQPLDQTTITASEDMPPPTFGSQPAAASSPISGPPPMPDMAPNQPIAQTSSAAPAPTGGPLSHAPPMPAAVTGQPGTGRPDASPNLADLLPPTSDSLPADPSPEASPQPGSPPLPDASKLLPPKDQPSGS